MDSHALGGRYTFHEDNNRASVREIDTQAQFKKSEQQAPGRRTKQKNTRIEIVEWDSSDSSAERHSGTGSVSLGQLMVGSTGGAKNGDGLTIDNLWKILASEKNLA